MQFWAAWSIVKGLVIYAASKVVRCYGLQAVYNTENDLNYFGHNLAPTEL